MKGKYGVKQFIYISRYRCSVCSTYHRAIPNCLLPYKHYDKEIILGVLEGIITTDILGYENYPCELTMLRWRTSQNLQVV